MAGSGGIRIIMLKKTLVLLLLGIIKLKKFIELDYMEYSSDALAQAAYVTNATTEIVDQQQTTSDQAGYVSGDISDSEYRSGQVFTPSIDCIVTAVEVKEASAQTSPSGNWTLRIETISSGKPSGTLANANASVVVIPPGTNTIIKGTFATPFKLFGGTQYAIVIQCDNQLTNRYWALCCTYSSAYSGGGATMSVDGSWLAPSTTEDLYFKIYIANALQGFSESTIKTQGSYSLKVVAAATDSLNKTLTRTIASPIDLSGQSQIKFDMRASRTGSNVKIGFHDSGGTTTEITPNILSADTFQTVTVDISAVADADKNAIDQIIFTMVNADEANTVHIDNMRYH